MIYKGRAATTGNSQSMAFEKALFRAHPEFASGRLEAQPISQNYLLVRAIQEAEPEVEDDPVLGAFLDFLAQQMEAEPHLIRGLASLEEAQELVAGIEVDLDEDLGDDVTLD
jgi:hypothetical protein